MDDGRQIRLIATQVTQVCFDSSVTLRCWQLTGEVTIRISSPFVVEYGGTRFAVVPAKQDNAGAALSLLNAVVTDARATAEGGLALRFGDGLAVEVAPDPQFEAWEMSDSQGASVISMPGGEIAVVGAPWAR